MYVYACVTYMHTYSNYSLKDDGYLKRRQQEKKKNKKEKKTLGYYTTTYRYKVHCFWQTIAETSSHNVFQFPFC